jgi:hypothetical protein
MAWTSPKTWAAAEVPTAALFNAHVRDNSALLKTSINDDGKFIALSSTYVADLDGSLLTAIVHLAAATEFTAGKNDFGADTSTRIIVPVGTDLFDGSPGNKTAGSIWIEGDYLHHIASNQNEWRFLGTLVGTPGGGAIAGSVWVDTDGAVHYIDADADERKLTSNSAPHTDAAALSGSVWVETYLHSAYTSGAETQWHYDLAHGDDGSGVHGDSHGDSTSSSHADWHHDTAHDDSHGDVAYNDGHVDEYTDYSDDPHYDYSHVDSHWDDPHTDTHGDTAHDDAHGDNHTDVHTDTHTDHNDHADYAHEDVPESVGT